MKKGPFRPANGMTKRPLRFRAFLVQPIPRDLELSLPYQQQAGFLTESSPPAAAFPEAKPPVTGAERQGSGLPYHSDEIVRDLHPLPFYPSRRAKAAEGTCCFSVQFAGQYSIPQREMQENGRHPGTFPYKWRKEGCVLYKIPPGTPH